MANPTQCTSCGKKITNSATRCPRCHKPVQSDVPLVDKRAETKGVIWAYVTGTLLILTGLGAFQIGVIPAMLLIFGGILALPLVRNTLVELGGFKTDKFLIIISTVLVIGGMIGYISSVKNDRLERVENINTISE